MTNVWPRATQGWMAVLAVTAASALASFDRAIITLAGGPLRRDWGVTDAEFGVLSGFAFAIPMALLAIPVGRLADRVSRKLVLFCGVAVWSLMTGLSGIAGSLGALLVARVGVGAGEAVMSPTAVPILADYFPPERRSRATSVYFLGTHFGQAAAFVVGGALLFRLDRLPPRTLPFVGMVHGWQLLFPIAGAAGVIVLALAALMREPARRELMRSAERNEGWTTRAALEYVRARAGAFAVLLGVPALLAIGFTPLLVFLPTLLQRSHGLSVDRAGALIGAVGLPMAIVGTLLAGVLGDRVIRRATRGGHARLLAWATALAAPFMVAVPLAANGNLAVAALAAGLIFHSIGLAVPAMAVQSIAPNQMRGQLVGAIAMLTGVLGWGIGPALAGWVSDTVGSLPLALALVLGVAYPSAALIAFSGLGAYDRAAGAGALSRPLSASA